MASCPPRLEDGAESTILGIHTGGWIRWAHGPHSMFLGQKSVKAICNVPGLGSAVVGDTSGYLWRTGSASGTHDLHAFSHHNPIVFEQACASNIPGVPGPHPCVASQEGDLIWCIAPIAQTCHANHITVSLFYFIFALLNHCKWGGTCLQ